MLQYLVGNLVGLMCSLSNPLYSDVYTGHGMKEIEKLRLFNSKLARATGDPTYTFPKFPRVSSHHSRA